MDPRRARDLLGAESEADLSAAAGWVAIVNPRSRGGVSEAGLAQLASDLRPAVDAVHVSQHAGHVETLVRASAAAAGFVVCGGDGTLFEVLQAMDRGRQRLALLPFGRGNSLARDLGVLGARQVARTLTAGVDRAIDLLAVTLRDGDGREWRGVSASNLAIGYPADVARGAARWKRAGAYSYAVAGVFARPVWITLRLSAEGDTAIATRLTGLIISNSKHVGPFVGFPQADLADGVFHAMELRAGRVKQTIHNLSSLTGWRFYEPVVLRDLRELRVELDQPALVKIDGELRDGIRDISVCMIPGAVTFRVPAAHHD